MTVQIPVEGEHRRREGGKKYYFANIVGYSAAMQQVYTLMEKAIESGLTVFLSGETGTGKELVAKAIHYHSSRKDNPLLELNCGAVPKSLLGSILFGYRKGAFTGAQQDTAGLFEAAAGGTVLLDEIGEMSEEAQVHLLRVLQEHTIQRLGETQLRPIDVRVIAITNQDIERGVQAGGFREDLYYRLNVFPIVLPALRERIEDIPLLAQFFLLQACGQLGKEIDGFAAGVLEMLKSYSWPGNVRELENEIKRAAILVEEGRLIQAHHFTLRITHEDALVEEVLSQETGYTEALNRFRRQLIEKVLHQCGGNHSAAARRLRMDRSNLIKLIKRLGIKETG